MKKILMSLFLGLLLCSTACYAKDAIYTVADGTTLKCTAEKSSGSLTEYMNFTDIYTIKNGKIYSNNLSRMFGNPNYTKKVTRLKISDSQIYFKDKLYRWKANYYKYVTIDRHTGDYNFKAKKDYNWYYLYRKASGTGTCSIINN